MVCCEACNCPLTLLVNATGKKERRALCSRCMEEMSVQTQVDVLVEKAKELEPEPERELAPVLRIDRYLAERAVKKFKRGRLLM